MMGVTRRISIWMSLAVIIGSGALALLVFQSRVTDATAESYDKPASIISPAVHLKFQVDKSIYKAGDTVLLAVRNDSRKTLWLTQQENGCDVTWWEIQQLQSDGETWQAVPFSKKSCPTFTYGHELFVRHTLKTGEWQAVVPSTALGNVVTNAELGTYRFAAKYLLQTSAPAEKDWTASTPPKIVSPTFTIQ